MKPQQSSLPILMENEPLDVDALLNKSAQILKREVQNLLYESSRGKLSAASARDLVAYIKMLSELKLATIEELSQLSNEELEKKSNEK